MNKRIIISFSLLVLLASTMIVYAQEMPELVLPIGRATGIRDRIIHEYHRIDFGTRIGGSVILR